MRTFGRVNYYYSTDVLFARHISIDDSPRRRFERGEWPLDRPGDIEFAMLASRLSARPSFAAFRYISIAAYFPRRIGVNSLAELLMIHDDYSGLPIPYAGPAARLSKPIEGAEHSLAPAGQLPTAPGLTRRAPPMA